MHVRAISPTVSISGRSSKLLVLPALRTRRRNHATVAAGVQRIHVAAMVEQRRHRGRMNGGHVVHLHVRFHRDLPVAVQLEAIFLHEAQRLEPELPPLRQKRGEFLRERPRIGIEVDEQEFAEAFDSHRIERTTRLVEADEVALVAQRDQRPGVVVNPAVVAAHQLAAFAIRLAYQCGAAMTARVVERAYLAVVGVKEHHALLGGIEKLVATGLRNFVEMAGEQPRFAPQMLAFERVEMRVGITFAGQIRKGRESIRRRRARAFELDQLPQRSGLVPGVSCHAFAPRVVNRVMFRPRSD